MAKTVKKEPKEKDKDPNLELKILKTKKQYRMLFGFVLVLLSIAFLVSFISFFVSGQGIAAGQVDQCPEYFTRQGFGRFLHGFLLHDMWMAKESA